MSDYPSSFDQAAKPVAEEAAQREHEADHAPCTGHDK